MPNTDSLLPESIGKRVDPTYSKTLQNRLQELLHCQADCFPGSQPVSFESKHLEDIQREDYFVCEKSDGVRYLLFFLHSSKGPASFLYDRNKYWYYVPNLLFPVRGREHEYLKDTLMDGELVLDIDQHKKTWRYLIFDLMVVNGSTIIQRSFSSRLGMLQQDVIQPFNARMRTQTDPSSLLPFTIELKKMERSYGLHLVFDQIPKLKHKSDGIIWTPVKYPYTSGSCEKLLKWKPPELNTVDFRIAARWSKEHKPIYSVEVLSNGVTYKFYDHFQPEPALATKWKSQLPDGRIAEFRYDPDCEVTIIEQGYAPTVRKGGWRFVRFRDDKSTANDEMVVKKIMNSIQDGVTKDQLLLYMDRVRAAWKAREKGLPMPPLHTAKPSLSLSTQLSPTSSALNTPTSANTMLQSPSSSTSATGYFREDQSRNNSISEDIFIKRKFSVSSITPVKEDETKRLQPVEEEIVKLEPVKEEAKRLEPVKEENATRLELVKEEKTKRLEPVKEEKTKRLEPVKEEVKGLAPPVKEETKRSEPIKEEPAPPPPPPPPPPTATTDVAATNITPTTIPVNNNNTQPNTSSNPVPKVDSPPLPIRRRKISSIDINDTKKYHHDPDSPPSNEKKQKRAASSLPQPPLDNPSSRPSNRRSKSIPQLPKESNSKKFKHTAATAATSSSIHSLLTTSVEPATRAYNFSAILQKDPATQLHQQRQVAKQQQQMALQQQAIHQQHVLQQQTIQQHHALQPLPQQLLPQRKLSQQSLPQQQQLPQKSLPQQQLPQQQLPQHHQQQPVQFINFHAEGRQNAAANNNHVMIIRSESQSQSSPTAAAAWKASHGQPFPYNDNAYQSPYQEHYQPYPQTYRRNEQQVAQDYTPPPPPQQQQQQSKRKNSQKAKLDFILN